MATVGNIIALHASHHLSGKHTGEIRVLAKSFLHAAPTRFAGNVDNRTITDVGALKASLKGNHLAHAVHERLVECAGLSQSCWHHSGADSHVAVRTFFGNEYWNSQTGVVHCIALNFIEGFGSQTRIQAGDQRFLRPRVGTQHSPQRTERLGIHALLEQRRYVDLIALFLIHGPPERTQQLTHFFVQGHLREQYFYALVDGQRGVAIAGVDLCLGLRFLCSLTLFFCAVGRHSQHGNKRK